MARATAPFKARETGYAQAQLFQQYKDAAKGKLVIDGLDTVQDSLFSLLTKTPPDHLYYFYGHGYAPAGNSIAHRDGIQLLRRRIEAIPENTPQREVWETLLELTAKMNDEAWMSVGGYEVTANKLKQLDFFDARRRPIVFMNMCQSADLVPSQSGGMVRVFLGKNASAIIGTVSPMTAVFANEFSRVMLDDLFAGRTLGEALWNARRHFLATDMRNPLGLAYTLYGRATARLGSHTELPTRVDSEKNE